MAAHSGWCTSVCKAEHLRGFINSKVIPEKAQNQWRIPGKEQWPMPMPGEFVVFTSYLERGLSFPTSRFLRQFLNFYKIKLSDLGPLSLQQISFFVTLCEGYLGCPPYFPLWLAMFHDRAQRKKPEEGGDLIASGGITFQMHAGKLENDAFLKPELPGKAESTWRKRWFYYKEVTPSGELALPEFTMEPSRPRRLNVKKLPEAAQAMVEVMLNRLRELKFEGLKAVNVYSCWVGRHLPPLRTRPRLMCDYTGQFDNMRTFHESWSAEEYERIFTGLTKAEFMSTPGFLSPDAVYYAIHRNPRNIIFARHNRLVSQNIIHYKP
jgi:hypothetical protein